MDMLLRNEITMFTTTTEEFFFTSHLKPTQVVLEYGSGYSTNEIATKVKTLISMEHQKIWYDKNITNLEPNCVLLLKEPNLKYIEGGHCGTYEEFKDYIEAPIEYAPFDIILIDGRARVACSSICRLLGHSDTLVFVHDYERAEYHKVLKYLTLVDECENMAKFKIK